MGASASATPRPRTLKGTRTRSLILDTALELFRKQGYQETTMRAIAQEANVSLGNAYYYFKSKEHLIQAYYARSHDEHLVASAEALAEQTDLRQRLVGVLKAKIDSSMPYHRFAGQLFKTAADPESPLSPFSDESEPVRREATELMREVVEGSSAKVPASLAGELPNLLWLYTMGIILFWIHDTSEGCRRTHALIDRTADIVVKLIGLARLPPLRPLVRITLRLFEELRAA